MEQTEDVQCDQVQDTKQKGEPDIAVIEIPPIEPVSFDDANGSNWIDLLHCSTVF